MMHPPGLKIYLRSRVILDVLTGRLKMREWKMRHGHNAGVENAGVENAGADCRGGKCRSKPHG